MTKNQQNNNQGTGYLTEIKIVISVLLVISGSYHGLLFKNYLCHGASGIFSIKKNTKFIKGSIRAFDFSETASWFVMPHGVISSELTKYKRPAISIAKIAIKVNNFFNVNEKFSRNYNNLTMEVT